MFPYLSDLINYLFGTDIFLPIPMFGTMVALAFLAGNYLLTLELKRKEKEGLLHPLTEKHLIGAKATTGELASNFAIGFLLGFKLLGIILNYSEIAPNLQHYILSAQGNFGGGIIGGIIAAYSKFREKEKEKREKPEYVEVKVYPHQLVGNITMIAAISGILGAKIFHNLENIDDFMADPLGALLSFSGLSIYGGLIVGGFSVVYYAKKKNIPLKHLLDAAAPALILAYAIGRIGCQLAGDGDWGLPNDQPKPEWLSFLPDWMWAFDYPNNVLGVDLKTDFANQGYTSLTGKAWPTPFYETVMSFIIFIILWVIRKKIHIPGMLFTIYLIFNGIERFLIEQIRINPKYHFLGIDASQAQIISTLLIISGLISTFYLYKNGQKQENRTI
jgi:prolipoprotein diacylglyceryl transferase